MGSFKANDNACSDTLVSNSRYCKVVLAFYFHFLISPTLKDAIQKKAKAITLLWQQRNTLKSCDHFPETGIHGILRVGTFTIAPIHKPSAQPKIVIQKSLLSAQPEWLKIFLHRKFMCSYCYLIFVQ